MAVERIIPINQAIDKMVVILREKAIEETDDTKKSAIEKEISDLKGKKE